MDKGQKDLSHLRLMSNFLDTKFEGPYGTRFGMDGLIGLVPGVGDFITSAISIYIIAHAALLGVGSATLIRMAINVIIENVLDMIPVAGNVFDFYWKANSKNLALIEGHMTNPARETIQSRMIVALLGVVLIAILLASGYITFLFIEAVFNFIVRNYAGK